MAYLVHQVNDFWVSNKGDILEDKKTGMPLFEKPYSSFKDPSSYRDDFIQKVETKSADGFFTDEEIRQLLGAREGEEVVCTTWGGMQHIKEGEHKYLLFIKYSEDRPEYAKNPSYKCTRHYKFESLTPGCGEAEEKMSCPASENAFMSSMITYFEGNTVWKNDYSCHCPLWGSADKWAKTSNLKVENYRLSEKVLILTHLEYDGRNNIRKEGFEEAYLEYAKKHGMTKHSKRDFWNDKLDTRNYGELGYF